VHHVETVVEELKAIPEADVVTAPEAVSTAKTTLTAIAATSRYGALVVFVAKAFALTLRAALGALALGELARYVLQRALGLGLSLDGTTSLLILGSALIFAVVGSLYPIVHGIRLSPVEAMREE